MNNIFRSLLLCKPFLLKIFSSDEDFLRIILPILDDEEQRRLQEMEEEDEKTDWDLLDDDDPDKESDDCEDDH